MSVSRLKKLFRVLYYYVFAHIILLFHYEKKYITQRWFYSGKYKGINALGWKWVVDDYCLCKRMRVNKDCPWPASPNCRITPSYENIVFDPSDLNNFQGSGCVFQTYGRIEIGKGTYIANNVGIITVNHKLDNLDEHMPVENVRIGSCCWIGMNAMILPGVVLGDHTIVGAGAVVTKSFEKGNCVIAGNPARIIKELIIQD